MTPLLEIRNLETFYGPIMALRGVSLEVHKGRVVTVLGANGAGKTTLLKTLSGIMDPEKGKILFEGQEIQGKEPHKVVRAGIVHVPEGREVFPLLTVEENLALGAYTRSDKAEIARDRDDVVVGKVNVDEAPAIAQQYGIQGIPFIGLFENGQLVKNAVGAMPRAGIEQALGLS